MLIIANNDGGCLWSVDEEANLFALISRFVSLRSGQEVTAGHNYHHHRTVILTMR